ncbi:caspase-1-like [Cloeon dipterum]|uniref:caspase-1-like n=1 Tax=Cloeon dipterum TaxID=197152 RepID=UPI0032201605
MSENKKDENDIGSQAEELNPSSSEEMHLKGADTVDGVVSRLIESFKKLELPSSAPVDGLQQYDMSHEKRGKAIIFNHCEFDPQLNLHKREKTDKDVERLKAVFNKHSFEVKVYSDLKASDLFYMIDAAIANADHSNADCVAVVILTHGEEEDVLFARDGTYKLCDLLDMITPDKCLSLAGKPKLIFVQASNGDKVDHGRMVGFRPKHMSVQIPSYADFLIAESRARGYIAMRYEEEGSLFVRAMEEVLSKEKSHTTSFFTLMTEVNGCVALKYQNNPGDLKQVPSITTTLTKELVLVKK